MKRFSYILAALLAGGATTALTSCIDTTEPAGITELRGAKAMLLKAKAAFIDAKTQREAVYLEQDKVQLESQKVDLELKKLNLELQKTLNAIKNDSANMAHKLYLETIQKKRDSLALRAEEDWWKVQKHITTAEQNYKKAIVDLQVALLTYKDEAIATKIEAYTKELYGDNWNSTNTSSTVLTGGLYGLLNQANLDLVKAQREKVLFTAKTDDYLNSLNLKKTKEEKILKIQQDLLARMKELSTKFAQDSLQAVKERIIEIDDAIAKLDEKKIDLYTEIKNMRRTNLASVSEKLAEYDATLNKDTAFVMDIVDEKLQNDLGEELATDYPDAFEKDADDNTKYVMKAAIEIKKDASSADLTLRNMKNLDAVVGSSGILSKIQSIYQGQYKTAYDLYVGGSSSASDLFEADGKTVKGVYAAQLKNELERLELDQDELRQDCKDAQDKWLKTYETLSKALDAYKGYKDPSAKYKAAKEAIDKYLEATDGLSATGTADEKAKYLDLSKKLRDQLVKDYYTYREPIDSVSSNYVNNFKKDYIDKDAAGKDQLTEANMVAFRNNFVSFGTTNYSLLGAQGFNSTSAVEGSALYEFLKAEADLFRNSGSTASSLAVALQPEKVDGKFVAPAGINAESYIADGSIYGSKIGNNSKFYKAAKTYEKNRPVILTTLADWVSLYDKIDGQMDLVADRVDGLIAAKKALVNANKDAYTAIWEKEIECYLIDAQITIDLNGDGLVNAGDGDVTNLFDENNPYYANYISSTQISDDDNLQTLVKPDGTLSEKGVLQAEKNVLNNYSTTSQVTYVTYNETAGKYETKQGRWEDLIAAQEIVVEGAQEDVDNVQQRIDLLTELGYMESNAGAILDYTTDVTITTTVGDNDQYIELLDKKIEQAQDKVNILKAEFDRIQAKIQDLIKAAEDADFGSSDATYPGFGVDNDPIEVPGTEDPEPENPEPENPEPENPEPENPQPENPQPENPQPENPQPENPQPENPDTDKPAE